MKAREGDERTFPYQTCSKSVRMNSLVFLLKNNIGGIGKLTFDFYFNFFIILIELIFILILLLNLQL